MQNPPSNTLPTDAIRRRLTRSPYGRRTMRVWGKSTPPSANKLIPAKNVRSIGDSMNNVRSLGSRTGTSPNANKLVPAKKEKGLIERNKGVPASLQGAIQRRLAK